MLSNETGNLLIEIVNSVTKLFLKPYAHDSENIYLILAYLMYVSLEVPHILELEEYYSIIMF